MADIRRTALFSKLTPLAYKSVEGATLFCKMRGNPYVELVSLDPSNLARKPTTISTESFVILNLVPPGSFLN